MADFTHTYSQGSKDTWNSATPGAVVVAYNPIQPILIARTDDGHAMRRPVEPAQVELFGTRLREAVEVTRKLLKK
jgi:hypothetical protein